MGLQVAQIIPAAFNDDRIVELNSAIPGWLQSKNSTESPMWLVDQHTGFSTSDLVDGVHPNASGDQKMADKWFPAVTAAIDSLGGAGVKRRREFVA